MLVDGAGSWGRFVSFVALHEALAFLGRLIGWCGGL